MHVYGFTDLRLSGIVTHFIAAKKQVYCGVVRPVCDGFNVRSHENIKYKEILVFFNPPPNTHICTSE